MLRRIPDWLIYGILLGIILANTMSRSNSRDAPLPPPQLGPALPNALPSDPSVIVEVDDAAPGIGTAFVIDDGGVWLTARHVVDGCNQIGLRLSNSKYVKVPTPKISRDSDTALITTHWDRPPLARDFTGRRQIGERGFFMGFPQGQPGEAAGTLLGRHRMIVRGRYKTVEPILAWAEIGRTRGLSGSLGGLSGGPVLDSDGEVIGVVAAESPRRGRVYTVAPNSLDALLPRHADGSPARAMLRPVSMDNYGQRADQYRRGRQIAQIVCLVNEAG